MSLVEYLKSSSMDCMTVSKDDNISCYPNDACGLTSIESDIFYIESHISYLVEMLEIGFLRSLSIK